MKFASAGGGQHKIGSFIDGKMYQVKEIETGEHNMLPAK